MKATGFAAVALVAAGSGVAQSFGRFTYGVLLPALRDELAISNSVAGFIGTLNVGAYLLGTLAVAAATSRYKLLAVMRVGLVLSTLGLTLAAVALNPWLLGLSMLLAGFGGAFVWIPAPIIAADSLPPERRRVAVGLMGSGIGIGIVFTGWLSGVVRSSFGDDAWRTVYAIEAAIGLATLVLTFVLIRHVQDQPSGGRVGIGGFGSLQRMPGWFALTMAYTSFGLMYLLVIAFLTTRLEDDSGWTGSSASLAFTLVGLAVVFGGPLAVLLVGRIGSRTALALAFISWSIIVVAILPGWPILTFVASAGLGLMFAGIPGMITLYVVENTSVEDYGPSFAAATLAFGLAQTIAPQVGGVLADATGSFTLVFLLSAALALTGTAASLQLPRHVGTAAT